MTLFLVFVLYILALLIVMYLYRVVRGPTVFDRVLGLNGISTKLSSAGGDRNRHERVEMFVEFQQATLC